MSILDKIRTKRKNLKSRASATPLNDVKQSSNRYQIGFLLATRHHTMLRDERRVSSFKEAILEVVEEGDVVVDLGAGTGILSMIAAEKARRVYAIELFPFLYEFGKETISRYGLADKVTYIIQDARTVTLPEKADVAICEMIHTGCISEYQIPVMNHAIEFLLKRGGKVIPMDIVTNAQIINTNYTFGGFEFKLPHYESKLEEEWETALSQEKTIREFDLTKINPLSVAGKVTTRIEKEGLMNSLKITSKVYLTKSKVIVHKDLTSSLEPIIFPFGDHKVIPGDEITIEYSYEPGAGAEGFHYSVT